MTGELYIFYKQFQYIMAEFRTLVLKYTDILRVS